MPETPAPDETLRPALEALAARDSDIARFYAACGLPPVRRHAPGFAGLLRIMCAQQVSAASARALITRLDEAVRPLTPDTFLALDDAALRAIGFSRPKVRYGRGLAEDVRTGRLDLVAIARTADQDAAIAGLTQTTGIGRWTAEIYLLFALGRPDVWPAGDLAVRVAVQRLKDLPTRPTQDEMIGLADSWRPYRSAAARFLWHIYRHPGVPDGGA